MKKMICAFFMLFFINTLFTSCDDTIVIKEPVPIVDDTDDTNDDDADGTDTPTNFIKVGYNTYELTGGVIDRYGADTNNPIEYNGYDTEISLFGEGLTIEEYIQDGVKDWNFVGEGITINFNLYSSTEDRISNGTYTFDITFEVSPVLTYDDASYVENYNATIDDETAFTDIEVGTVTFSSEGNVYTVDFEVTAENDKVITGHFEGELPHYTVED